MLPEFKSILDLLKAFPTEQSCIDHLEKLIWDGNPISPFDPSSKVYKCKANRYRCKNTGKYFNIRTNTIFDNSKVPLQKWFLSLYIFSSHKKGVSSHQLAKDIDVTQKSAWFMLHRLRYAFEHPTFQQVLGENGAHVQADETYIGGKEGNKHKSAYAKRQKVDQARQDAKDGKPVVHRQGRSLEDKTPVIGVMASGVVIAKATKNVQADTLKMFINWNVVKGATLVTDQYKGYIALGKEYKHETVQHNAGQYYRDGFHTNSIEGFWSQMKRGIYGIYHHCSTKHLQAYVDEFTLRYNSRTFSTSNRINFVLSNTAGRRLTYNQLIADE